MRKSYRTAVTGKVTVGFFYFRWINSFDQGAASSAPAASLEIMNDYPVGMVRYYHEFIEDHV